MFNFAFMSMLTFFNFCNQQFNIGYMLLFVIVVWINKIENIIEIENS